MTKTHYKLYNKSIKATQSGEIIILILATWFVNNMSTRLIEMAIHVIADMYIQNKKYVYSW